MAEDGPVEAACVVEEAVAAGVIILGIRVSSDNRTLRRLNVAIGTCNSVQAVGTPAMMSTRRVVVEAAAIGTAIVTETETVTSAITTRKVAVVGATGGATVKNEAPVANGPIGTNHKVSPVVAVVNSSNQRNSNRRLRRPSRNRYRRTSGRFRLRTVSGRTIGS